MPIRIEHLYPAIIGNGGKQLRNSGRFGSSRRFMPLSFHKERNMSHPLFASCIQATDDPVARLDAMIADARSAVTAADAEVAVISTEIAAIEPHPHAHGHTAAGDCTYASIQPQHFLPLAACWPTRGRKRLAPSRRSVRNRASTICSRRSPARSRRWATHSSTVARA